MLTGYDAIFLKTVKNAGRGVAGPVVINASAIADDNRPMYGMSTINIASLEPGETVDLSAEIKIYWNNIALGPAKSKAIGINVDAYYWDSLDMRHMTRMSLFVVQDAQPFALGSSVAPGVALSTVHTTSVPVWRLKFRRTVSRVPLLGRFVSEPRA